MGLHVIDSTPALPLVLHWPEALERREHLRGPPEHERALRPSIEAAVARPEVVGLRPEERVERFEALE
jgi:hypothetical protein